MNPVLLLGAGFSSNWGGWLATEVFEYLLGSPEIARHPRLRQLLWKHQAGGGFEGTLTDVQSDTKRSTHSVELHDLQFAIARMFDDMNRGYDRPFEFQQDIARMVRTFLVRFNVIFTLNQDLLLERHYLNDNVMLSSPRRWDGYQIPGMVLQTSSLDPLQPRATGIYIPSSQIELSPRCQPIYKLHGSSNWRDSRNDSMMIVGGNKKQAIGGHEILAGYSRKFVECLSMADTRLMVIGYGFRDLHINEVILDAIGQHGLKLFVIDPNGSDLARKLNPTRQPGAISQPTELEAAFEGALIGASRRPLSVIFGDNAIEHAKVMRFFE